MKKLLFALLLLMLPLNVSAFEGSCDNAQAEDDLIELMEERVFSDLEAKLYPFFKRSYKEIQEGDVLVHGGVYTPFLGSERLELKAMVYLADSEKEFTFSFQHKQDKFEDSFLLERRVSMIGKEYNGVGDLVSYSCLMQYSPDYKRSVRMWLVNPETEKRINYLGAFQKSMVTKKYEL